jgi:hypothetical protein
VVIFRTWTTVQQALEKISRHLIQCTLTLLTLSWLDSLTQLQETCLNTSFSPMISLLMLTFNTSGKICVKHRTHISLYNLYSSRSRTVLITQRQGGGSPSVRQKISRLITPKYLQLESSTVRAAVGMQEFLQSRLAMLLKLTSQLPISSTSKSKDKQRLPPVMPMQQSQNRLMTILLEQILIYLPTSPQLLHWTVVLLQP